MGYWPYSRIFSKYKANCNVFIETGTHMGDSVQDAIDLGFKKIYSVEINPDFFNLCVNKFNAQLNKQVFLYNGDSTYFLPLILEELEERAVFWLDAHEGNGGNPLQRELEMVKNHPIKNHVILIDDLGHFGADENYLKETILSINSDYKFDYDQCTPNRQLIAYT